MYEFLFIFLGGMGNDIYLHTVGKLFFFVLNEEIYREK